MQITILGAGVLGVTTAYMLEQRGYSVTVIDRRPTSAMETSFANGGQLSYSHAEPWANPSVLPKIAKWAFQENSPLVLSWKSFNPEMIAWGMRFLGECLPMNVRKNTLDTLKLALYSRQVMAEIRTQTSIEFDFLQNGILHFFTDEKLFAGAVAQAKFQAKYGCEYTILSPRECLEKEPSLARLEKELIGGIFHAQDESGDIHRFTQGLAAQLRNTKFIYNTEVQSLVKENDKIIAVQTNDGVMSADAFVVALGSYSPKILNPLGIKTHIYPMKGYSVSVPINGKRAPHVSVTDQGSKIVYSRLGNILRAAGTAEFAGHDDSITEKRIAHMKAEMQRVFGDCGDFDQATDWACLRPQTPAGTPTLGKTPYKNLFLNTGHGTLGWTLAAGSAKVVADIIDGKTPAVSF